MCAADMGKHENSQPLCLGAEFWEKTEYLTDELPILARHVRCSLESEGGRVLYYAFARDLSRRNAVTCVGVAAFSPRTGAVVKSKPIQVKIKHLPGAASFSTLESSQIQTLLDNPNYAQKHPITTKTTQL
jgi:hypothetical protein